MDLHDITIQLDAAAVTRAIVAALPDFAAPDANAEHARPARAGQDASPQASAEVPRWLRGGIWAFDIAAVDAFDASLVAGAERRPVDATALQATPDTRGIAVLPIHGFLTRRATFWSQLFGGTALTDIEDAMRAAVANPDIRAIVLDMDSPGGGVTGVHETFEAIRAAAAVKPVHAVIGGVCASAAYWLASAASSITISPSAEVGSIGVFGMHADRSAYFAAQGITVSVFAAPAAKAEATDVQPLTDDARAAMRARVESHYGRFVADVATGRGVTADAVRGGYGGGRVVGSDAALAAGLVDAIATPAAAVARFADGLADHARRLELARFRAEL